MKKNIIPFLLTVLLGFVAFAAPAQSWNQKFSFGINYSQLNHENKLKPIFNLLASNNNKNVNTLNLKLSFACHFFVVEKGNDHLEINYSVYNQRVSGDVFFRDFKVDSLLIPEKLAVQFLVYKNGQPVDTLTRILSMGGGEFSIKLTQNIPPPVLAVKATGIRLIYTAHNYQRFLQTAGLINNYYGYLKVMQKLPRLLQNTSGADISASRFYLNNILLKRLKDYIRLHDFTRQLHLGQKDPLDFTKVFNTMSRLQTRMKTLSQQHLQENEPTGTEDKENFTRGYVAISIKAITLSNEQQPYIATSFHEFSRVFPNSHEQDFVKQTASFFDKNIEPGRATVPQEIYKYFIDAASLKNRQQSFVQALDFLSNAAYFEHNFPDVKRIPEFDRCLVHARDGLAISYLKVAQVASENNDRKLTERYMAKAAQSLAAYNAKTGSPIGDPCYVHYFQVLIQMAEIQLGQAHYHQVFSLLNKAEKACNNAPVVDSLIAITCNKLLEHRIEITHQLFKAGQLTASGDSLLQITKTYSTLCPHHSATQNQSITKTAANIFQGFLEKSTLLHQQNKNILAMSSLNNALQIQKTFSLPNSPLLQTLIAETTVPYISSIADEASLEIWKKHFKEADSLFRMAQDKSLHYGVSANPIIKSRLDSLSHKIEIARCRWKQEEIRQLLSQTRQKIKAYQLASAKSLFLKAQKHYNQPDSCVENKQITDSTFHTFEALFRFTDAYHELTLQLFKKGFAAVLPGFARLEEQYKAEKLKQFGLPFTGLYPFVRSQHSESLILEAVHYFIQRNNFREAFRYLQISENIANAKPEQKQLAEGFAKQHLVPGQNVLRSPEWKTFTRTYRKISSAKAK